MARKNQWEQFADNFTTFYNLGNTLQTGMATKKIMEEEPEVVTMGGIKQPHQDYQATYGGKSYDKEITADQLRGLQYDRIGDVKARFGDAEGAMSLREKASGIRHDKATLEAQNLSNKLASERMVYDIEQARLNNKSTEASTESVIAGTNVTKTQLEFLKKSMNSRVFAEYLKTKGLEWDNKSKKYKALVEKATMDDEIAISGSNVTNAQLKNKNLVLANMNLKITNSGELIQLDIDKQTKDSKIKGAKLELKAKEIENLNNTLKGTGMMYDNALGLINVETQEALKVSNIQRGVSDNQRIMEENKAKTTAARLENNGNLTLIEYSEKVNNGDFEKGGNAAWLRKNWTGDPETKAVLDSIEDDELNVLMREGTMIIKRVEAALTGTRDIAEPAIMELIDGQDSIPNNVQILQSPDGTFIEMVQTDENGENHVVIARGEDWATFKDNLQDSITPRKALGIAKANADIALVQAQTDEINMKIEANGIDVQKVNTQWAGIQEKMVELGKSPLEISTQKLAFVDSYITSTKGLGDNTTNNDSGFIIKQINP